MSEQTCNCDCTNCFYNAEEHPSCKYGCADETPKNPWKDAEGNPDWDAYASDVAGHRVEVRVPHLTADELSTQYWITLTKDGICFANDGEGCSPDQAREFATALMAAADLAELT